MRARARGIQRVNHAAKLPEREINVQALRVTSRYAGGNEIREIELIYRGRGTRRGQ
jgi:hypothetical protein